MRQDACLPDLTPHPTTPQQDAAALHYLRYPHGPLPDLFRNPMAAARDNCASRSNAALDAAGIHPTTRPIDNIPGTAGRRAQAVGALSYLIPKGTANVPVDPFTQFEPGALQVQPR